MPRRPISDIKVLAMDTGENVICTIINETDFTYQVNYPMIIEVCNEDTDAKKCSISITKWLKYASYFKVDIDKSRIICISNPMNEVTVTYNGMIHKIETSMRNTPEGETKSEPTKTSKGKDIKESVYDLQKDFDTNKGKLINGFVEPSQSEIERVLRYLNANGMYMSSSNSQNNFMNDDSEDLQEIEWSYGDDNDEQVIDDSDEPYFENNNNDEDRTWNPNDRWVE